MKIHAIALDYDGTIAYQNVIDPAVRDAIAAARAAGIVVLLVTGRILEDLRRVAGDLHFVDGVVAENGAVIHFPANGHVSTMAPRIPDGFTTELRRRGIPFGPGECLVDADTNDALRLLEVIRDLQLPLVLIFNGDRVMAVPQGTSKATGLQNALTMMRLSPRNTLAIGDAENDHELLRLAEIGVAVEWGSTALQGAADIVLAGTGTRAVAAYIRQLGESGQLPASPRARRRLVLGNTDDGREFSLAVRGRNIVIAGDERADRSWAAGVLCEQLIVHGYSLCVIDDKGDYASLEGLPGVSILGGDDSLPDPHELQRALKHPDRTVTIDLSRSSHEEKVRYIREALPAVNALRKTMGVPHRIVLGEAQEYLNDSVGAELLDLETGGYVAIAERASRLPNALLVDTEGIVVTRQFDPEEREALHRLFTSGKQEGREHWSIAGRLKAGQAVGLQMTAEAGGHLQVFTIAPRVVHRRSGGT